MSHKISSIEPGQHVTWTGEHGQTLVGRVWFRSAEGTYVKTIALELGVQPEMVFVPSETQVALWDGYENYIAHKFSEILS